MVRYSELSKAQKKVFDKMRSGIELQYKNGHYQFADGELVRADTPTSLGKRNFIFECHREAGLQVYCINAEVIMPWLSPAGDTKAEKGEME